MDPARRLRVVVLSGAGLSAESGVPTFRGNGGLWEGVDPMTVADITTWKDNAEAVHAFFNARRLQMNGPRPNAAHAALAAWAGRYDLSHFTQNIDLLAEQAGCPTTHLHGRIDQMQCTACGRVWDVGSRGWDPATDRCACGSRRGVKPGVVFFGERAPRYADLYAALEGLRPADVLLVIGTSGLVLPTAEMARQVKAQTRIHNALEPAPRAAAGAFEPLEVFEHDLVMPATSAVRRIEALLEAAAHGLQSGARG